MSYAEQFKGTLSQTEMRERSRHPFFNFHNVNDEIWGHLVHVSTRPPDATYGIQRQYTLRLEDGSYVAVCGKGKDKTDGIRKVFPLETVALGTLVGVYLKELRDTGKPQKAKIIDIKVPQDEPLREDYVKNYQGFTGLKPSENVEKPVASQEYPVSSATPEDTEAF